MDVVVRLIEHLLDTTNSIDKVDSIVSQLSISKDYLLKLLNENAFKDYFQFLHSSNNNRNRQGSEKIALTLDLFCCTHYAQSCKNQSCPFLHLCPYNIRPMYTKCTNKNCPFDHDILTSIHNRRIIDARGLSYIPARLLYELTRASADPSRSFWICNDYGKKDGCSKRTHCDKLHYCYYALTDSCTKLNCQHIINDACLAYFRRKEIDEQEYNDILDAFRKVLRQRKFTPINTTNISSRPSSTSTTPKLSASRDNERKSTNNHQRRTSPASRHSASASATTTKSSYDDILSTSSDTSPPLRDHVQDILLLDYHHTQDYRETERYLSHELGCPIKLLTLKDIHSENKNNQNVKPNPKPIYYYCPVNNPSDIFQLLRWQNDENQFVKPLIVYASIRDAHDAAKQNFENNQFCLFRVRLLNSGVINGTLLPENRLQLKNPLTMCFDRMWIYTYNFSEK